MKRLAVLLSLSLLLQSIGLLSPLHSRSSKTPRLLDIHAYKEGPAERIYFYSASGDTEKLLILRKFLLSQGARKVNLLIPFSVVCELPPGIDYSEYLANTDIVPMHETDIRSENGRDYVFGPLWAKQCYAIASIAQAGESRMIQDSPSFDGFRMPPRETVYRPGKPIAISSSRSEERAYFQNSEFMIGDILVQIIFPESTGPQENWTDRALSEASGGAMLALIYYQETYSRIPINFILRTIPRAVTNLEPIDYIEEDQDIWITDVMNHLEYYGDQSEYLDLINQFNNEWRIQWGTDWVFTAFIVNSANDPDHHFGKKTRYIGFSELGGPHLALPYPAEWGSITPLKQNFLFEMGHVFWAHYEHVGSVGNCDSYSGYLNYQNFNYTVSIGPMNSREGCTTSYAVVFCIMNFTDAVELFYDGPPCRFTTGMFGLADADNNRVPDAADSPPEIEFENAVLETVLTNTFDLRFKAISSAVPNQNPNQVEALRADYAFPIKDVSYLVNNVGPMMLSPEDGKYDEEIEDFVAQIPSLLPGITEVKVITRNSLGATSQGAIKHIYYLGLKYMHFIFHFVNEGIFISWNMLGETFDAKFDLHRIETAPVPCDSIIASDIQPSGPPSGLFLPFSCFDGDVVPGHKYKYYVEGTFSAVYNGKDTTITHRSKKFEVYASLHMSKGSILSDPAPNPFKDHTLISINVPPTYREAGTSNIIPNDLNGGKVRIPSVEEEIPTGVNVTVYNALGQRVKNLHSGRSYSTILTILWDGTNNNNERVPSGMYFIRAEAGPYTQVKKVLVVR